MKAVNPLGIFNKSIEKEKFIKAQKAINPSMSRDEASKNFKGAYAATKEIKNNETKIAEFKQTTGFSDEQVAKSTEGKKLLASREQSTGELAKYDLRAQSLQEEKTPTAAFASAGEQQEAANEKLRAQGQQQLEQIQMSEAGRIQGVQMSEAGRMQEADVAGKQFVFGQQEAREMQKMDRVAGQLSGAQGRAAQARADQTGALTGMIGGITSTIGSMASSGAFKSGGGTNTGQFKSSNYAIPATWKG